MDETDGANVWVVLKSVREGSPRHTVGLFTPSPWNRAEYFKQTGTRRVLEALDQKRDWARNGRFSRLSISAVQDATAVRAT